MQAYTYIIIGASAAGISALNKLWQLDPTASIACISDQIAQPYNTCFLADYARSAKSFKQITLHIAHQNVNFILGKKVIAIDREKKSILLSDNSKILFQKLLLATGSRAIIPPIAGNASGIFNFHTLDDVQKMLASIQANKVRKAVLIGAGLTGLECADMLYQQGIAITMIEKNPHILSAHLPFVGAAVIQNVLQQKGVFLFLNQMVTQINYEDDAYVITLSDSTTIETDLVICTVGVQPNSELAQKSGLAMQASHIAVNEYMQTSDPSIFAAGDVTSVHNQTSCIWAQAVHQASIAAHAMVGNPQPYVPEISLVNSHFFGLTFAQGTLYGNRSYELYERKKDGEYLCVAFDRDIPSKFQFVGVPNDTLMQVRQAMLSQKSLQLPR